MTVEFVRELPESNTGAKRCLVRSGDSRHFVVSSADELVFNGGVFPAETLVFPADENGTVNNWIEVAGGKRMSREEAIADLEAELAGGVA